MVIAKQVIAKGYGVRATTIECQNAFAPTLCFAKVSRNIWGAIHSTKIPTGPTGKSGLPQKVDQFFLIFPVEPNQSIEFWTKISGNFG